MVHPSSRRTTLTYNLLTTGVRGLGRATRAVDVGEGLVTFLLSAQMPSVIFS
jgi:hypothetical protein